jgi:DNA-binding NarL/FixJ family response regulator
MGVPTSTAAIRVLVVDDSLPFRAAVHELIDGAAGFTWAGEACSGEEGIEAALRLRPDLLLMDVRMPGIGGIAAATRIASHTLPPVVILITGADLPTGVPDSTAAEILAKHLVSRKSLKRLWEDHACH